MVTIWTFFNILYSTDDIQDDPRFNITYQDFQ